MLEYIYANLVFFCCKEKVEKILSLILAGKSGNGSENRNNKRRLYSESLFTVIKLARE